MGMSAAVKNPDYEENSEVGAFPTQSPPEQLSAAVFVDTNTSERFHFELTDLEFQCYNSGEPLDEIFPSVNQKR